MNTEKSEAYHGWNTDHEIEFLNKLGTIRVPADENPAMYRRQCIRGYLEGFGYRNDWGEISEHAVRRHAEGLLGAL